MNKILKNNIQYKIEWTKPMLITKIFDLIARDHRCQCHVLLHITSFLYFL